MSNLEHPTLGGTCGCSRHASASRTWCPGLPGRPKVPGTLWEPLVKDTCEPVDSPGERGDCPDLGCGDLAGRVYLAGRRYFEGVAGFGDGVVGFLFWQPHGACSLPARHQACRQRMTA